MQQNDSSNTSLVKILNLKFSFKFYLLEGKFSSKSGKQEYFFKHLEKFTDIFAYIYIHT